VSPYIRPSFGAGAGLTPAIRLLLGLNITVYILQKLAGPMALEPIFGLVPSKAVTQLHVWQFVTYMFLHGNFLHLLINMFMLWMFGREIETLWGRRTFLQFYFVCGVGGGLLYWAVMPLLEPVTAGIPLIGASGAVFGLLLAYGMMFPNRELLLYFILPIKAKYMVVIFGLIDLLGAMQGARSNVGHLAHLGGLFFGWVYLAGGRRWLDRLERRWRNRRSGFRVVGGGRSAKGGNGNGQGRPGRDRVDEILEKISRQGLDSLTEEEQEYLRRVSRKR